MPNICVALTPETTDEAVLQMVSLAPLADMFELRVDAMRQCDLATVLAARTRSLVVTNRAAAEGGRREQPTEQRLGVLAEAVRLGADYIDVELAALPQFEAAVPAADRGATRLIVSFHDTRATPDDLPDVARRIEATSADIVKVVATARTLRDNLTVFRVLRAARKPTVALAMGPCGRLSRILAGKFGALFTFASSDTGDESAPGQITARQMRQLYRAHRVGPDTRVYAVMGNPVEHSLSPAIHNAAFHALGLDAVYVPLKVEGDPADVVRALEAVPVDGYSVTIPHKEAVMAACAHVDDPGRAMRAVNTLIRRDDGYHATNTDLTAAMNVLARAIGADDFTGKRALVVGAGGVGRAFVHGLVARGATVAVTDLDPARRDDLAAETGARSLPPDALADLRPDVLMNASPVGMWPRTDASPVDPGLLRPGMIVFDAVYNPQQTRLLRDARGAGCITISGVEQFVGQAVEQFELWTGRPAPVDLMRQVVLNALLGD